MTAWTKNSLKAALLIAICIACVGCLTKFPYLSKETPPQEEVVEYDGTPSDATAAAEKRSSGKSGGKSARAIEEKKRPPRRPSTPEAVPEKPTEKLRPEDEAARVKTAARELAGNVGQIARMKVCYSKKDKEWWAVLYEDLGSSVDVRQFIWSPEGEKFEPFLVMKRIPKGKLDAEAKKDEIDKTCTGLDPPAPKAPKEQ